MGSVEQTFIVTQLNVKQVSDLCRHVQIWSSEKRRFQIYGRFFPDLPHCSVGIGGIDRSVPRNSEGAAMLVQSLRANSETMETLRDKII
jgi:hypothetical protein